MNKTSPTYRIIIKGLVQGVGFRPFIYRIAQQHHIYGWVRNSNQGVEIEMQGAEFSIKSFLKAIHQEAPPAAEIISSEIENPSHKRSYSSFKIAQSQDKSNEITEISPDIAVCHDCLEDMKSQAHRNNYPFTNCTNCGPRFSIIKSIPYDRPHTTMASFTMCPQCNSEYTDISNRRFHAQPIACNQCGPQYTLHQKAAQTNVIESIIKQTARIIDDGGVIVAKGTGGFFICGDARKETVVKKIRTLKKRDQKPFAVMFSGIKALKKHIQLNKQELECIQAWQRPVVLLKQKSNSLAHNINEGLKTLGCILPYMPLHYQIFEELNTDAIIYTSANFSNNPIIKDNQHALTYFGEKVSGILSYNRNIENRIDDSVVQITQNKIQLLRRARGFAPRSIQLPNSEHKILAMGADQKSCFAIGTPGKAVLSQHMGELSNAETYSFYQNAIEQFMKLFHLKSPKAIAIDAHPDYVSSNHGQKISRYFNIPLIRTFHHHAHIASVMAEHQITEKVIGISMDGTGYGRDGHIWGSEFMTCDLREFTRAYHFEYMPMPGGETAIKSPWKMAISFILQSFKNGETLALQLFGKQVGENQVKLVIESVKKDINCPLTCGAGRLFDAVAAILGVCLNSSYEAEAPMKLESLVKNTQIDSYAFRIKKNHVSFNEMFHQIISDMKNNETQSVIATRFHQTMIEVIVEIAQALRKQYDINTVALSGGLFQNMTIVQNTVQQLEAKQFRCLINEKVPPNDGGIALGQLAIANAQMSST